MSSSHRIRVRVIHDDPIAQEGLAAAFAKYADLEVETIAHVNDSMSEPRDPRSPAADVVVADYVNGLAFAAAGERGPYAPARPKVMVLAAADRECEIKSALERGVRGYVLTGCTLDDLAASVRAVHRGERHLSPQIAARLAESLSVEPLTAREEEVLKLVVSGLCNKAIGKLLGIAVGTVKTHLKSTFDKLQVQSRTQAVATVKRRGLFRDQVQSSREPSRVHVPPATHIHGRSEHGQRAHAGA